MNLYYYRINYLQPALYYNRDQDLESYVYDSGVLQGLEGRGILWDSREPQNSKILRCRP